MKKSIKNLVAIFCLVSVGVYSENVRVNNLRDSESLFKVLDSLKKKNVKDIEDIGLPIPSSNIIQQTTKIQTVESVPQLADWSKAPNSYIFDPSLSSDGLYIPVKKAYVMWRDDKYMGGKEIPSGKLTANVLWEDVQGLIKSDGAYSLEILGSGENAKIKVPINKSREGNAVITFSVNNEIYWSWHVWVTDDPTKGSTYRSFENLKRIRNNNVIESIPASDWKWMDRNLGAISSSITGAEWNRNGGLLYQWGRKDPMPPLVMKGNGFYEASGRIGRVRHRGAKNFTNAISFDALRKFVTFSNASVGNNIRLSVRNPLSLIYVNKDDNSGPAYYNNNTNLPVNWFGRYSELKDNQLSELNLWSDNSQGKIDANYKIDNSARPYRDKSSYDPCPNGWRIPSMLVANLASSTYVDDIRVDFSPYGLRTNLGVNTFEANQYHKVKPTDTNVPAFMKGFRMFTNGGYDLSNVGGYKMGVFPGTGQIILHAHEGQYTDQHHTALWTATMTRHFDQTPSIGARGLFMVPDKDQPDIPDPNFPNVKGRYFYEPLDNMPTADANGCRCIRDPLYVIDDYNFPTEYIAQEEEYTEGLDNPNSYQLVKNTINSTIEIPINKAFAVQSGLLNNKNILNTTSFNNLKANVLWTTNSNLISTVLVNNPSPNSLSQLSTSSIVVGIRANQSGNAVVTLHNGSISNPVYWSWHIWVTDTPIASVKYTTELPVLNITNYVNYVEKADVILETEFMDRNLGAVDAFPTVVNPLTPTTAEMARIRSATGLHYQWGRKDPIPIFQNADNRASYNVFLGSTTTNGTVSYTTLPMATYNNLSGGYIVAYNTYTNSSNANILITDKTSEKIAKVLSYSVRNPLVYMIPSTFAPYNSATPTYTNGTDWLLNEPNLASDRWGRGGDKSPFDPCPEGWRIPDITNTTFVVNQDFGITPWYKKDKNVGTLYSIINDYAGTRVRNPTTTSTIGYTFNNSTYPIGNYPNSGTRGFRTVTGNQTPQGTFDFVNFQYPGIWTAALNSNYIGRPISLWFDTASTANRMIAFHDNNDPYFGMSCRCVKVEYSNDGDEQSPISSFPITSLPGVTFQPRTIEPDEKIITDRIVLFPNPVENMLYIKGAEGKKYSYQIFNMSGQIIKSGIFENNQADVSSLASGVYLVKINAEILMKMIKR
ncbi:T9SS C-terminal target domain-containing protein [Chryseobacterium nematophagum]|uniref:T9SS C-terminal target domain-containing protein n=1 Tax=Chryseobacterium nematophagum TaxID=2305228 RepID=A0A3M7LE75_9FLAO|nr:T9SS type A sorting domain-containing protein [Chryseobacterium nematophagum]RMZ60529.1 T9SS C-terminal target domain-containing protein [Chryseobacterium nematophagum]